MLSMNKTVYIKSLCSFEYFEGLEDVHVHRKQFKENVNRETSWRVKPTINSSKFKQGFFQRGASRQVSVLDER